MASAPSPASRAPRQEPPFPVAPPVRWLSNGRYRVLITPAGTGGSAAGRLALTRWTADAVEDPHGFFVWVRDRETSVRWRMGCGTAPCRATSRPGAFRIERAQDGIEASLEICVAPDADAELRRVRLVNAGERPRELDLTTFAEIVLNDPAAHRAHPGFSKLFLQTEHRESARAILARRRPRARGERYPWLVHAAPGVDRVEVETDRARFLGRGMPPGEAAAFASGEPLSGTVGAVLDAVASLRTAVDLPAGARADVTFVLGVADDREGAVALAEAFRDPDAVDRAFEAAGRAERERLTAAGLTEAEGESFQALAGAMEYGRAGADFVTVVRADGGGKAIGDVVRAHGYWRSLGIPSELVVLSERGAEDPVVAGLRDAAACRVLDVRRLSPSDLERLAATARLVVGDSVPEVSVELHPAISGEPAAPGQPPASAASAEPAGPADAPSDLRHFNGYGGFSPDGTEYVIRIPRTAGGGRVLPPNPWINVIANEDFGCIVSETGAGATWSGNSRERRLTPWANDPVLDPHSEAFYLRDEESGDLWSPMPGPAPGPGDYETRHGFGASVFRTRVHGIESEVTVFVPRGDRVRVTTVRVRNAGKQPRRLSVCAYARLVLGADPETDSRFVVTEADGDGTIFARSTAGRTFGSGVAFAAAGGGEEGSLGFTTDRRSFLGVRGTLARPAALAGRGPDGGRSLDGRTGSGIDPCIAQQLHVDLAPGQTRDVVFLLGEAAGPDEGRACAARYLADGGAAAALEEVRAFWTRIASAVRIETPSPELDLLVNGWLPYQVLSCRMWGRSALYQSGGAFGFRDQLQDSAALLWACPERTREQILLHAAHQFAEGDVLHWWHPPDSRGIRTRFADDLVWLPSLTALYIATTGDASILDESVPFLTAPPLEPGEAEAFLVPEPSGEAADLYEHCCRALDRAMTAGAHGLPLFGAGDWNDGMNRVGADGKGESVWMAMFLHSVLGDFLSMCEARADGQRAARYRRYRDDMRTAVNENAWDGDWYLRGYYDDGEPLGSHKSDECRIDALVQSWAVLSGTAPADRAARAMAAVEEHLVSEENGLIRLLTPPFDRTRNDPGYIRGYVPGVRENGGQYTHAALWVVRAMAAAGRRDRVAALLDLLNPIRHAASRERADTYRVEPYVIAADVYGEPPHVGRGGWTWYTGAAGWMHRIAVESLLGVQRLNGRRLRIRPCVPDEWPEYRVDVRVPGGETRYEIRVTNPHGTAAAVTAAQLDGRPVAVAGGAVEVELADDGAVHRLEVELGPDGEERP